MTAGCTDPSLIQKINRSGIQRLMRNMHPFLQSSFRYYSYTCPCKLSHSLKFFFQARIRLLILYLQNAVQFNKARELQNQAISAFSPLPREKDKCSKPENRRSNSLLFQFTSEELQQGQSWPILFNGFAQVLSCIFLPNRLL